MMFAVINKLPTVVRTSAILDFFKNSNFEVPIGFNVGLKVTISDFVATA